MENNNDSIKNILDEVHNSEEYSKCRENDVFIYENEFILKKQESYQALKNSGMIKTTGSRSIAYTIILIIAIAGFLSSYIIQNDVHNLAFAIISFIVMVVIWLVPYFYLNKLAKVNTNGNVIKYKLFNRSLQVFCNENSWYIPLDNSNRMKVCKDVIVIKRVKDDQLFVIPLRAIDDNQLVVHTLEKGMLELYWYDRVIFLKTLRFITTRYGETDMMSVIHHSVYALYYEEARVDYMKHLGLNYKEIECNGLLLPLVNLGINYKKPARFPDQLTVETTISKISPSKITFVYKIFDSENNLLNVGFTEHGFVDTITFRPLNAKKKYSEIYKILEDSMEPNAQADIDAEKED